MYIVEVAPLTKIPALLPQVFSYFSARQIKTGVLLLAQIGRRHVPAIVIETHELKGHKIEIKSAGYEMKPIKKILSAEPILTQNQIKLAIWLGQYYFAPPGLFMKMMYRKIPNSNTQYPISNIQKLIIVPTMVQVAVIAKNYRADKTVIIYSGLRTKQLNENWQKIASGQAEIIIGTRLAVFAPFAGLKEIIIEDETNSGHRSWDMFPHYRAHEIARKLTEIFGAKLSFENGLPSVESRYLLPPLIRGGWRGFFPSPIPPISLIPPVLVDLRAELHEGNFSIFSLALQKAINETLAKNQQAILFINRRGAGTFVLCRDCGYVAKCKNCDTPLTYHLSQLFRLNLNSVATQPLLICHHCGQKTSLLPLCPKCQSQRIKAFGSGTQRVEVEAQKLFPGAKILRLDSDVTEKPAEQQKIIDLFKQKKADILIGTQMILSAGLPKAALVAIISADTLMHLPDFRSDERLFQTITQLKNLIFPPNLPNSPYLPNPLIIQTYNPDSRVLRLTLKNDFATFYKSEVATRQILKYPPFSQLIKLTYRHKDPKRAGQEAKVLFAKLTQQLKTSTILNDATLEISEPAPAFIAKQKGRYVWQIVIKAKPYWLTPEVRLQGQSEVGLQEPSHSDILKNRNKLLSFVPAGWEIDIDPETLL